MTTIKIITDGSCDLPKMLVEEHGIIVVPLSVHFGEVCMPPQMELCDFYAKMNRNPQIRMKKNAFWRMKAVLERKN